MATATDKGLQTSSMMTLVERMTPIFEACGIVDDTATGTNEKTGDKWYRIVCKTMGETFQYYVEKDYFEIVEKGAAYTFKGKLEHDYRGNLSLKVSEILPA
ncbi:hypothetical protein [Poriferisphaera sp. WC338]|uniref:hypothetical protein n=1 Tax=Poriferisphaera sp. WC338 TaxID=3425129 RepID=UPI003D819E54